MPESIEMYPGTNGKTHGDKKDISPASSAVNIVTFISYTYAFHSAVGCFTRRCGLWDVAIFSHRSAKRTRVSGTLFATGFKTLLAMSIDVLIGDRQNEHQIPRRMAARDDKFVERRVRDHDINEAKALVRLDPLMSTRGKASRWRPNRSMNILHDPELPGCLII